ncbi:uncharacterized protein BXIN_2838 [Babesia sp. Xinjiang]|uniref:uncharacterized protein n=1 Tax=Babesia sp. Xinjiang TaxID=462227 RepID=UPI000A2568A2|nr:uncharacterized protein BXIN_2838 [Babesia sp. Xinjiang]ORM39361.1 hypothetical protein BXIN_2838 [Babesia sp. Xinjiang]
MNRNSKHVYSTNKRFLKLAGNNDVKSQFNMPLPVYIYDHVYGATKANPNGASPIRGTPTALPITGYNAISPDAIKTTAGSYTNTGQNVSSNVYATSVPGK